MDLTLILVILSLAFLAGLLLLGYLVVNPLKMSTYLLYTCFTLSATGFALFIGFWGSWTELFIAIGLCVVAFFFGYVLMASRVLSSEERKVLPPIRRHGGIQVSGTPLWSTSHTENPPRIRQSLGLSSLGNLMSRVLLLSLGLCAHSFYTI